MPPLLSRLPEELETPNLGVGMASTRPLSGANFVALDQHFLGQMTSSTQNFRYFWSSAQGITLAGLAPKVRQIASIRKKQRKRNEMGYLIYDLRFDLRATVLALGVKMYWGQELFFKYYVFLQ